MKFNDNKYNADDNLPHGHYYEIPTVDAQVLLVLKYDVSFFNDPVSWDLYFEVLVKATETRYPTTLVNFTLGHTLVFDLKINIIILTFLFFTKIIFKLMNF